MNLCDVINSELADLEDSISDIILGWESSVEYSHLVNVEWKYGHILIHFPGEDDIRLCEECNEAWLSTEKSRCTCGG